jgi:hypothetical protein
MCGATTMPVGAMIVDVVSITDTDTVEDDLGMLSGGGATALGMMKLCVQVRD